MAPKVKYFKESIINDAFNLVREEGIEALSARSLAKRMNSSPQPIFTYFKNMGEVKEVIYEKAKEMYKKDYIKQGLKDEKPFKGAGMKYIEFALKEKNLFKILFMTNHYSIEHYLPGDDESSLKILDVLVNIYHINEDKAKQLYNTLSVFVHGIACLFAMDNNVLTIEDASNMLTLEFMSLTKYLGTSKP